MFDMGNSVFVYSYWWRRGELNPCPKVLHFVIYVRSHVFLVSSLGRPTDRATQTPACVF